MQYVAMRDGKLDKGLGTRLDAYMYTSHVTEFQSHQKATVPVYGYL